VLEPLRRDPHRFSLFAALRLLERAEPDRPRLGTARRPADETVMLEQPPHLEFAPGDIAAVGSRPGGKLRLEQLAFGVFGPNGALPFHLTEYTFERRRHHDDPVVSDFINLFQHRMLELFYRAWADSDHPRATPAPKTTRSPTTSGALIGLFSEAAAGQDVVPDYAKLSRRHHRRRRSAEGLQSSWPTTSVCRSNRQFVGGWLRIPVDARTRLGVRDASAVIGEAATLGSSSWQRQNRFEVAVGPLSFETFMRFLPGSRALGDMSALIRFYTTDEWAWQVRLLVAEQDVPGVALGEVGRLGWTSWLGRKQGVATDVVLQGGQAAA
jgi:type VI secretion system protein ImpH